MVEEVKVETRAQRVARRRVGVIADFNLQFEKFCDEEYGKEGITYGEKLSNVCQKMEGYIRNLVKATPQDKTFYKSITFEWQGLKLQQLEEVMKKSKAKQQEVKDDRSKA